MADVIFLSFQQTPVFWEEEEVSDHVFFFLQYSSVFAACVIKAIRIALVRAHILAHLYCSVLFLWFMAEFSVCFAPTV